MRLQLRDAARLVLLAVVVAHGCQAPNSGRTFEEAPSLVADDDDDGEASDGGDDDDDDDDAADGNAADDGAQDDGVADGAEDDGAGSDGPAGDSGGDGMADDGGAVEQVEFEFSTLPYGGEFDPDHIIAIWIEQDGAFVRTLQVHADNRREHLIAWRLSSGEDLTDAITGATIKNAHGPLSGTWDLRDSGGNTVGAGSYTLKVEMTADNSNAGSPPGPVLEVPFSLDGAPVDESPDGGSAFPMVHVWSP